MQFFVVGNRMHWKLESKLNESNDTYNSISNSRTRNFKFLQRFLVKQVRSTKEFIQIMINYRQIATETHIIIYSFFMKAYTLLV
ncbi:hypothetical protein CD126_02490 [Staphylococcus pettenkoferi]|nr:hypothetical protein CD126_02490 [Staphylococcus pettenkoferi]